MVDVSVTVRTGGMEDVAALALVGAATFLDTYAGLVPGQAIVTHCAKAHSVEAYRGYLAEAGTRVWLAEVGLAGVGGGGAAPVGFAMVTAPDFPAEVVREGDAELKRIYLLSRFHGVGAGRRMMEAALTEARAMGVRRMLLGMHPGNHRARAFYEKCGFSKVGERRFVVGGEMFLDPVMGMEL